MRPLDVLAVELGSFQLHWSPSVVPLAAAVLNVAPDHLDWWGDSFDDYAAAKGLAFAHREHLRHRQRRRPGQRAAARATRQVAESRSP